MAISKSELLKIIDRALRVEEETVQDIIKYIISSCQWLDLTDEQKEKIVCVLNTISKESAGHGKILSQLREQVVGGDKDVY